MSILFKIQLLTNVNYYKKDSKNYDELIKYYCMHYKLNVRFTFNKNPQCHKQGGLLL